MLTVLEVANFWSTVADDARRYQQEKLRWMQARSDVRYIVVRPDVGTWTEVHGQALVERIESPIQPGGERALISGRRLRDLVQLHRPDLIECGSPALLPMLVQVAAARLDPRPALVGFWHGDLARSLVGPSVARIEPRLATAGERAASWWTKQGYAGFDAVFVPSRAEARTLAARGLDRLYLTPMGVDAEPFAPEHRDPARVEALRAGVGSRPIVWTDLEPRLAARVYAALCRRSSHDPALVLAGPNEAMAERLAAARAHVHAPRFSSPDERAAWLGSCDLALLGGGAVACAEAMATQRPILASTAGGRGERAGELVREAGCGRALGTRDPHELAEAALALARADERDELGRRGRAWILRFDWPTCFERILECYAEVLDHVRRGRRVPPGVHERRQPAQLGQPGEPANHSA